MIEYVIPPVVALVVVVYGIRSDFQHYAITSVGVYKRIKRYDVDTEADCVACGEPTGDGELRKASKEIVLFGCPIYTTKSVENYYCETHSSFEYRRGETVTSTKERLGSVIATLLGLVQTPDTDNEPEFQQLQAGMSSAFNLVGIAFVVLIAAMVIGIVKGFGRSTA